MKLDLGLTQKLQQSLILTPVMRQSLEILQLPIADLEAYISKQLTENPVLELKEQTQESKDTDIPIEQQIIRADTNNFEYLDEISEDIEWQEYFNSSRVEPEENVNPVEIMEDPRLKDYTIRDYLREQLIFYNLKPIEKKIVNRIIESIDDRGYLTERLEEIAANSNIKADISLWEEMLDLIQHLDPPGVGARNLKECLLLQLNSLSGDFSFEKQLIKEDFEDVVKKRIPVLAKKYKKTQEEIAKSIQVISNLNPSPGELYNLKSQSRYIIPDVIVKEIDGEFIPIIPSDIISSIYINPSYEEILKNLPKNTPEYKFIKDKINAAKWLLNSLKNRNTTLYNIAREIINFQKEFFEKGPEYLRPMTLKDIAEKTGFHIATIGRTIANKYIQTPYGIYPMKYFFSKALSSEDGEEVSNKTIINKIKQLIANEDKKRPYSDSEICKILKKEGINIARRTVTKYRSMLNIPSRSQRKEYV